MSFQMARTYWVIIGLLLSVPAFAVTDYQASEIPFTKELADFKASITPAVRDEVEKITIPPKKLKVRIVNPKNDQTIEPVAIQVPRSETGLKDFAEKLAAPGKSKDLANAFLAKIRKVGPSNKDSVRIELKPDDFSLLNLKALGKELQKENHVVTVDTREMASSGKQWDEMREQLGYILSKDQMSKVSKKVRAGTDLSLENDLLPPFPKRMSGKFIVYRGPNCFHASLSFFDQQMPKSPEINIKEEEGYHRSMINYDELWRVISNQFYEIDPRHSALKYGDLMVFFQVPESASKTINFKWIRHTSVYLFGPYTYSKGSKSPTTPYSVKTLAEEWNQWQSMVSSLGMRVYRRQTNGEARLPIGRDDWIY
ncbi:MAG: hypothetical protein EOP07_17170 [Proteobacteria bacterium]|nr:MAG: hypothetical protein EOP07_17170 [Pseudomonadota bacterium]